MSCANCSSTVSDAVTALDGVEEASVNYATDDASVTYDPDQVGLDEIFEAIAGSGYEPRSETITIAVTDMSCANCSEAVGNALEETTGVVDADVNFATDEAQVEYVPGAVSRSDLYDAIESAGYTPVRDGEGEDGGADGDVEDRRDAARKEEIRKQFRLTIFGAALSAPMLFFIADKFLLGGTVVPETVFGVKLGWVEFALATPVQYFLGREFYRNSYTAIVKNRTANMDVLIALGSSTAYFYSLLVLLGLLASEGLYFDTAALILVFITLGNYLEA
ncbi:MAG: copper ion binding protein, partial [archaeon]